MPKWREKPVGERPLEKTERPPVGRSSGHPHAPWFQRLMAAAPTPAIAAPPGLLRSRGRPRCWPPAPGELLEHIWRRASCAVCSYPVSAFALGRYAELVPGTPRPPGRILYYRLTPFDTCRNRRLQPELRRSHLLLASSRSPKMTWVKPDRRRYFYRCAAPRYWRNRRRSPPDC